MIVKAKDVVTLDFHGKKRMGVILQANVIKGLSIVAIGYGLRRISENPISIDPSTRNGKILRIYKETFFYKNRVYLVANDNIYLSGNRCPADLFNKLVLFTNSAFENSASDQKILSHKSKAPQKNTKHLSATLGELAKTSS